MEQRTNQDWTTESLAKEAGVSSAWIRQLLIQGKIKGEKFGHIWRIPYVEGQRWLETHASKEGD